MAVTNLRLQRKKRHARVRQKVSGTALRPRLCVFRSLSHINVQVIDDVQGHTLAAAGDQDAELTVALEGKNKTAKAEQVGALIARRVQEKGITEVVFDRGGYQYHGRVKALAEGAREAGLKF